VNRAQMALVALCPSEIAAGQRFALEETKRLIDQCYVLHPLIGSPELAELSLELIKVDADLDAIDLVAVAISSDGRVAEMGAGVGNGAPESVASLFGCLLGPERVDDLIALGAGRMEREVAKEFAGGAAEAATVFAAPGDREWAEH